MHQIELMFSFFVKIEYSILFEFYFVMAIIFILFESL